MMLPMLRLVANGLQTIADCEPELRRQFGISDADASALLPSGKQTYLSNRAHWARNYLSQAGLVEAISRGRYRTTPLGDEFLASNPAVINVETLKQFPKFLDFLGRSQPKSDDSVVLETPTPARSETPEDLLANAYAQIETSLTHELLEAVQTLSPVRFERLILDLLKAMGYGAGSFGTHHLTKTSGDGGIDGIIHEDALGLDAVYIQAKRYQAETKVGRPAIQQFIGSLTGEGATKGVFVTTSDFSTEARGYLAKVQHRVVLIGGRELARLMIRHGVGVRDRVSYVIRSVDEDYFSDPEG
jgi:restriction system protein